MKKKVERWEIYVNGQKERKTKIEKDTEKKTVKWKKIVQYLNATSRQKILITK